MAVTREAIVICLDVGPQMRIRNNDQDPSTLELAVECINWILQRKIFSESKDEFAIVLFGTQETENPLANDDTNEYSNICVTRELQAPTWDLVKYVQNEIPPPDPPVPADFMDAIVVAMDHLVTSTQGKKYAGKQLVLFSNLGSPFGDDQTGKVADAIKNAGIEFTLFGPNISLGDDDEDDEHGNGADQKSNGASGNLKKTDQQELGEQFVKGILEQVNGAAYSLAEGLSLLSKFTTRVVRPVPWKCNFEIGETIKIPICMYVKTKKAKPKQSWKWTHGQDPNADITMQKTYHKREDGEDMDDEVAPGETQAPTQGTATKPKYPQQHDGSDVELDEAEPAETQAREKLGKELDKEDIIKGYNYGNTVIPLDKLDLEAMKYKNTEKCLKLLKFIKEDQAKRQYYLGDGCHVVFADPNDEEGATAFAALWEAMERERAVALVRYAHSARSAPRLGAVIPSREGQDKTVRCFVFVPFPFREDERTYGFPSLSDDSLKPTDEQLKAIDGLLTSIDLTQAEVDEMGNRREAYEPSRLFDPYLQNMFASLAHRALYQNQPLPPVNKRLVASLNPLEERLNLAKHDLETIRNVFPLKKKEVKREKRTGRDIYQAGEAGGSGPAAKVRRGEDDRAATQDEMQAIKISSVRPAEEYAEIVEKDEDSFQAASEKLESIIAQFIFDAVGSQFYEKAVDCIEIYRRKSITVSKPGFFNSFIKQLRKRLLDAGKRDFVLKLAQGQLGLISEKESKASDISSDEARQFFEEKDEKPPKEEPTQASSESNLLDELE